MKISVLITERFELQSKIQLQTCGLFEILEDKKWFLKNNDELKYIKALIIRSQTVVDDKLLSRFPKLELIVTGTTGFDHIDLMACKKNNVIVSHCPDSHSASAAELTWSLVLSCARRLKECNKAIVDGDWDRQKLIGTELNGKTYGIIGLGRIGQKVAKIAQAFSMSVMAYDPYQEDNIFSDFKINRSSLEELLSQADVISIHTPLTTETRHMIGEMFLESVQPHAILINTARGPIIHEKALLNVLQNQKIGAVGLDVFEYEPLLKDSKLLKFKNVVVTPHVGATTHEAFYKSGQECKNKVIQFFTDKKINDVLKETPLA